LTTGPNYCQISKLFYHQKFDLGNNNLIRQPVFHFTLIKIKVKIVALMFAFNNAIIENNNFDFLRFQRSDW